MAVSLTKTHQAVNKKENQILVSIARNPVDTILSATAMVVHYGLESSITETLRHISNQYLDYYNYMIKEVDVIINFYDIEKYPKETLVRIAQMTGVVNRNPVISDFELADLVENRHLHTSKNSVYYDKVKNKVKDLNLEKHFVLYEHALASTKLLKLWDGQDHV